MPTFWGPILSIVLLWVLYRKAKVPRKAFFVLGLLLVVFGSLFALLGMGLRALIIPGEYEGWSCYDIWEDQILFGLLTGGTSILAGIICIFKFGK